MVSSGYTVTRHLHLTCRDCELVLAGGIQGNLANTFVTLLDWLGIMVGAALGGCGHCGVSKSVM